MNRKRCRVSLSILAAGVGILSLSSCVEGERRPTTRSEEAAPGNAQAETERAQSLAPDFSLADINGGRVRLSEAAADRPVLLAFWASWCGYCRKEIPKVQALRDQYSPDKLEILAVNIQEDPVAVKRFVQKAGIRYRVLTDADGEVANNYGINGIPLFVLVSKGRGVELVTHQVSGPLTERIKELTTSET